ncbi:hypothetical protein GIB67_001477 [Kingdonia uniflora]|uniref:Peptidase S54 rhomboid domain-containing protein n=1 Tax=Kingdonia uniflora TaxID=39325 RepID=A0A7J7LT07_9MAGN|nr:hypothetical protein GIB67_001477 [Kingdonia uniflora]
MGTVPTPSSYWFREGPTPSHLITTAAALRLGNIIHLRPRQHLGLGFVLRSPFKELSYYGHVSGFKNFLESSHETFSTTLPSWICNFSKKEIIKNSGGEGNIHPKTTSTRRSSSGRQLTNVLLAINVVVFFAQVVTQGKLMLWGAKINSLIDRGQLWRLATSSLLHGNIGHLMANSYSLNSMGPTVETISGPKRFLVVYLTSAVASSAMSYYFCKSPSVGASGAIFGLVGSFAVFVLRHRNLIGGGKDDLQQIAHVLVLNMVIARVYCCRKKLFNLFFHKIIGLMSKGIDNWGHLGGFLGGVATSWLLGPAWKFESRSKDGKSVFVDRAPITYLINRKKTAL